MNLRSGKVKKRHVKSSSKYEINEEDIISKLPNELLTQILSLLPESEANRTRILSKRWKNLSSFLPYLHIAMPVCLSTEQRNKFYNSVDQTLAIRDGMVTQRFILHWTRKYDYNRLYNWLRIIIQCKVQEIELKFPDARYHARIRFPWDLFETCNTLVELTLKGRYVFRGNILFPCLKKLSLVSVIVGLKGQTISNLISGCPVLEELIMERNIVDHCCSVDTCKVSSQSLKRLRIVDSGKWHFRDVIDAPNLEYLYVWDDRHKDYNITNAMSLVEVHISSGSCFVVRLVTRISFAKILTMTHSTTRNLATFGVFDLHVFPNLVKLVIGIDYIWDEKLLLALLNKMPNVEHITFLNGRCAKLYGVIWREPREPPACMRLKMKVVIMEDLEAVRDEDLPFIRYLLKHSEYLERLTITVRKIDPHRREELLDFPRGSSLCRVELI